MGSEGLIRRLAEKQARLDSEALPRAATKRIKSKGEAANEYHEQGYYLYFCFHNKTLYEPCTACHRTKRDAKRNLSNL